MDIQRKYVSKLTDIPREVNASLFNAYVNQK